MKLSDLADDIIDELNIRRVNAENPIFQMLMQHKDPMSQAISDALYGTSIHLYTDEFAMRDRVIFSSGKELCIRFRLADGYADRIAFWLKQLQVQVGTVWGELRQQESFESCEAVRVPEILKDEHECDACGFCLLDAEVGKCVEEIMRERIQW